MISSRFFRRASRSKSASDATAAAPVLDVPCTCPCPSDDSSYDLAPSLSRDSSDSTEAHELPTPLTAPKPAALLWDPPTPKGGSEIPILLPNEVLLQRFPNRKSNFRTSNWRLQQQRLRCRRCSVSSASSFPDPTMMAITENSQDELGEGVKPGVVYVTSERIVFVPKAESEDGFSVDISALTGIKAIESTMRVWYFVCYRDNMVATMPFSTQTRCESFLKLIKNIRFEHMVRRCLPPRYCPPAEELGEDDEDEWWYGDNRLPSYDESEQALHRYLVSLGLLNSDAPTNRTDRISSLIELATMPQSQMLESPQGSRRRGSSPGANAHNDAYHSPYVWF